MSNWKRAYGWFGHILANADECDTTDIGRHNVIAVPPDVFASMADDMESCRHEDEGVTAIQFEHLGVVNSDVMFIAAGNPVTFSEGFTYYGTVFEEADGGRDDELRQADAAYLKAMKERYGIDLPPCKPMIGCSSEH